MVHSTATVAMDGGRRAAEMPVIVSRALFWAWNWRLEKQKGGH
jgi:hypothetical protein